jgi:hypothetical protein
MPLMLPLEIIRHHAVLVAVPGVTIAVLYRKKPSSDDEQVAIARHCIGGGPAGRLDWHIGNIVSSLR